MLINNLGRFNPSTGCRVFSETPKNFYKLNSSRIEYITQHKTAVGAGLTSSKLDVTDIKASLSFIDDCINNSDLYKHLFKATAVPFCFTVPDKRMDLGRELEDRWLPLLKAEFEKQNSGAQFRATLQGNSQLSDQINPANGSGYAEFLDQHSCSTVVGYYFPTAFQEFDISSQRKRIINLPALDKLAFCLSGPFEIIYTLVCYPDLLFDRQSYSPILCASSLEHKDPRMVMIFKSYGPHLEFWLMSQMLTPSRTQVSEQWSGGLTIYTTL